MSSLSKSLRHVFATWALHEARIPIEDLSRLIGGCHPDEIAGSVEDDLIAVKAHELRRGAA